MKQIEKREKLIVFADLESQMAALMKILGDKNLVIWLNANYDPTGTKADYTQWLARQFKKIGGLPDNIVELLMEFDRLKKIPSLKGKFSPDIGSYKTIEDVRKAIAPYQGYTSKKQQKKRQVEGVMMDLKSYGEVTYGSHGYLLLYVDDAELVAKFLNTLEIESWCIRHEDMAESYIPITFLIKNGKVVANLAGSEGKIYDRNDDHSTNSEHYEVLLESGSDILFEDGELYESFPDALKMKVRAFCAKDAKRAQTFAQYILHDMFPEGEESIAKSGVYSYLYAYTALGSRFQAGEQAILEQDNGDYAINYAVNIMRGRWPAAEKKILERPHNAVKYARNCIKGEWIEAEPIIATDADSAVSYAINVLQGPFPNADATIAKDSYNSYLYAKLVLKHRFPEGEPVLLNEYGNGVKYATDVMEQRWPELEERLAEINNNDSDSYWARQYARYFSLYFNEELKKFISLSHIEPEKEIYGPPLLLHQTPESLEAIGWPRPPEGTELEGEVGRPVDASFRSLESMIMVADLESQMPALLKIIDGEELIRELNEEFDPTGKKADYTQWIVKQYKKNKSVPGPVGLMLKEFDRLKKIPSLKGKLNPDINSYKTPEALRAALSQFAGTKSKKEERRTRVDGIMMNLNNFGEKITHDKSNSGGASYIILECSDPEKVVEFLTTLEIDAWCIKEVRYAKNYVPIVFLIRNGAVVANLAEDGVIYDRQDESSDEPEHYSVLLRNGYRPTDMDKSMFEMLPNDVKEIVRKQALTSSELAFNYAAQITDAPFPEGEEIIATNPALSVSYARWVLRGRFKAGEKAILGETGQYSNILENYITNVLSISGERWLEGESEILKNPTVAQLYARDVIKGRWPEAEEIISRETSAAYYYARNVIKGRFPEGEDAIARGGWLAFYYATDVLHERFELGEKAIAKDYYYREKYCNMFSLEYDVDWRVPELGKFLPYEESKKERDKSWGRLPEADEEQAEADRESEERTSSYRKFADLASQMPILLKMYHNGAWNNWDDEHLKEHITDLIRDIDPTGDKATFARWIAKQDAGRNRSSYSNGMLKHILTRYDELRKIPKTKGKLSRDIISFADISELSVALNQFEGIISKKKEKITNVQGVMMNLGEYGDVKYSDEYTLIHMTDPRKVSDFLIKLQITSWCIKEIGYAANYVPITFILKDGKVEANLANDGRIYDRGDNTDRDPGHYAALLHGGFDVKYIDVFAYNQLAPDVAGLMRKKAAENPGTAYTFSVNVLDGPFPEGEPAMAKESVYSYQYAFMVLHDRFPMGEPVIATHYSYSYSYARNIIHGRWPEGEPAILKNGDAIIRYAERVIMGRWSEGEDALLNMGGNMDNLLDYADKIVKGRWLEAEPLLLKVANPWTLYWYAKNCIHGRWPEAEARIGYKYDASLSYAEEFGLSVFTHGDEHYEFKEVGKQEVSNELS